MRYPVQRMPPATSAALGPRSWPAAHTAVAAVAATASAQPGHQLAMTAASAASPAATGQVNVAGTPVFIRPASAGQAGPTQVAVTIGSQDQARRLGLTGVAFSVTARAGSGRLTVGLDYASFASAYGGNYGERLRLVELPACALTTPQLARCATQQPVPGAVNLAAQQSVTATVALPATRQPVVLAATTTTYTTGNSDGGDGGGAAGSYTATTLKPSGSWSAGGSTGDFTYSYPITVPSAPSDMAPSLALSYDSGELDGQTAATEAQANWLGDGWSTPASYIEQSYVPCADKPEGTAAAHATNDMCYDGQVLSVSLNGLSTSLVYDTSGSNPEYVLQDDNGDVVTKVTGSGNGTMAHDTSYWVITDRSGIRYYFGLNELPGWQSEDKATNSVDWEPVFAAHSGDPCFNTIWSMSVCNMAYRWNLDYVVDPHGNAMAYYYDQSPNAYLENAATSYTSMPNANATYIRDSYLDHIDYGFTDGSAYTVNGTAGTVNSGHAPDQVRFATGSRCSPTAPSCPAISSSNSGSATADYPDVPYDLNCTLGSACLTSDPTYWSTVRLSGITTWQWNGSAYAQADGWSFGLAMPGTGNGTSPTLFLSSIGHTGDDTTAGGSTASVPAVTFPDPPAGRLNNRVNPTSSLPAMTRQRITSIVTETGSVISVAYELAATCTSADQASPATNTGSCFPVWWTPAGLSMQKDWFNKYQVASVTQTDPTGGSTTLSTSYSYLGGAAWHYDDNEVVKQAYRTYGQYRGFGDVQTFTGSGSDEQTETETTYYRGMSDDATAPGQVIAGTFLKDSQLQQHEDIDQLAGNPLEVTDYNYKSGPVTSSTIYSYWVSAAAATRDRSAVGLPSLTANTTGQVETWDRQALQAPTGTKWRETETDTSYYSDPASSYFGLAQYSYEHGDLSLTGNNQQRCTVNAYEPPSASGNIVGLVAQVETVAEPCGGSSPGGSSAPTAVQVNGLAAPATPSGVGSVVADACTIYDNPARAQGLPAAIAGGTSDPTSCPLAAPTMGDISEVLTASGYSGGTFTYQPESAAVYDSIGRVTGKWDSAGNETQTAYTANAAGLTTGIKTTNALGQSSSVTLDPLRGITIGTSDLNGITSTMRYDGLGRIIAEWNNSRAPGTTPANATFTYTVTSGAPSAVTTSVLNDSSNYATSTTLYDALLRVRQTQEPTPQGGRLVTDTFYDSRDWQVKVNNQWRDSANAPSASLATVSGQPIADSLVPDQTVTAFDGLGRPVLVTSNYDGTAKSKTATVYDQDVADSFTGDGDGTITVSLNASGAPYSGAPATETVTDAPGRTTQLLQYTTLPSVTVTTTTSTPVTTTVSASGGTTQATDYGFNDAGQPTTVADEAPSQSWTSAYNLLGQATSHSDPDSGTITGLQYDRNGNLIQSTDARGKTTSWTYDALNRKTGEYDAPYATRAGSNEQDAWSYDNANGAVAGMVNPVGHLTTATSYVGGSGGSAYAEQAGGFDDYGDPLSETISIPAAEGATLGTTYKISHTYEAITGNPAKDIYPASPGGGALPAETVTHGYSIANGVELPATIAGLDSYGANVTYTAFGQVGQEEIGSPTATNAFITNTYDPHTGQLMESKLANTAVSSTPIDDTTYGYDPLGNPVRETETRQGTTSETQCFAYDTLDRLKEAWTATDSCAADPDAARSGATVGDGVSGAAYWTSWTFTPLGERATETDHGLSGAADTVTTYSYDQNGKNQPGTLTGTSTSSAGTVTSTSAYQFDADGNVTSRQAITGSSTTTQQLNWNDNGTLGSVVNDPGTGSSATSSYVYDANGTLLLQKDPGTTTLYLPNEEIILSTTTGAVTGTRFYPLPGGGEAVRTGADPTTAGAPPGYYFQLSDQHGTATLAIDPTLTAAGATWREFTPYGGARGPAVSWAGNLGFLNRPDDTATGLTNIGARWYDPVTGTFQSIDPVFEATSPQQHNGYTYSGANPVSSSDPTGLVQVGCNGACPPPHNPDGPDPSSSSGSGSAQEKTLSEYKIQHDFAVAIIAEYLRIWCHCDTVKTELYIPDAHWKGAKYGYADVVYWGKENKGGHVIDFMWVWEVKHCCGDAEQDGPAQLSEYISALEGMSKYKGWDIQRGFNIPQLVTTDPLDAKRELVIESTNTRSKDPSNMPRPGNYNGIVAYWTRNQTNQRLNSKGYAVLPAGTHVSKVTGKLVDGGGEPISSPLIAWGNGETPAIGPLAPVEDPGSPAQVPEPAGVPVNCEVGLPGVHGAHQARTPGVVLDVKVSPAALAACGGSLGDPIGDDGGGDGTGDDEGGFNFGGLFGGDGFLY